MTPRYVPAHTLRIVCQLANLPHAHQQIPVALAGPKPNVSGVIVMLDREE